MQEQERVFAYHLAKTISHEDLSKVTGGAGPLLTTQRTIQLTGASGAGVDGAADGSVDW